MSLGQVLCVVTGASRGFGLGVCRELGARVAPGSALLMVSRSEETLRQEAERLRERCPGLAVHWVAADLSSEPGLRRTVTAAEEMKSGAEPQTLIIINNAGSLGDISKRFVDMVDMGEVDGYLSFNVSSALCLTTSMLRSFPGLRSLVVNVSSLAAIKPFRSWALYCAGKAARDMMFRVLAEEEADLRVLSYGPGPLDTDMQEQVRTQTADAELRQLFVNMKNEGKLVDIEMSARKMLDVLLRDTYKSGDHVDFYDDV
ncbi:sepiapterin reductase [Bufo gargarizans]|uniref:sepiapterin reductase n=1 Tax=Bufo gargarizans TaxID=30331 RepID=UPI001CF2F750|nr:sepiapterin reductase [Bufo gargarizans]